MALLKTTLFFSVLVLFQSLASAQVGKPPFYLRILNAEQQLQEDTADKAYFSHQPIKIESSSGLVGLDFICILQPDTGIAFASRFNHNSLPQDILLRIMAMKAPIRLTLMVRDPLVSQPDKKYAALQLWVR